MKIDENVLEKIMDMIEAEFREASSNPLHKPFNSFHEGYAVMKEEVDELWDEVKKSKGKNSTNMGEMVRETVQVGAMTARFLHDLLSDKIRGKTQ